MQNENTPTEGKDSQLEAKSALSGAACSAIVDWCERRGENMDAGSVQRDFESVIRACSDWVNAGQGNDCFWEGWPECPTEQEITPMMVLRSIVYQQNEKVLPPAAKGKTMSETKKIVPVGQPRLVLLGRGIGRTHADEIKALGLQVGDVLRGKEGGDVPGRSWWHEVRLKVLWVGEKEVVYRKQWRANHHPDEWHDDGEVSNFTLSCREYYFEENAPALAQPDNQNQPSNT